MKPLLKTLPPLPLSVTDTKRTRPIKRKDRNDISFGRVIQLKNFLTPEECTFVLLNLSLPFLSRRENRLFFLILQLEVLEGIV